MHKRSFAKFFPTGVCLFAATVVPMSLFVSCDAEKAEPGPPSESTAAVENGAVSAPETAPIEVKPAAEAKPEAAEAKPEGNETNLGTADAKHGAETWECVVYPPEDRSDGKYVMYAERVYYDGNPEPETERIVYLHAPASSVNLVIPDGVTELDPDAFHDCANLESVVFPNSVNMIPANAFSIAPTGLRVPCCPKLKSVVLPVHAAIGAYAFYNLESLESVTVNRDGKAAALPREDAAIGDYAFFFCPELKEIAIPEGVKVFRDGAFSSCQKLERVSLPASLKTIGRLAFLGCSSLKEIAIPEGVTEIADDAFQAAPCRESVRKLKESRGIGAPQPKEN